MAANIRLLRGRIKTARNITQITKAMEMVAASKMRKAQERTIAGKPYTFKLAGVVGNLVGRIEEGAHPYLIEKEKGKTLLILFSSDKGLCGSHNTNLLRQYFKFTADKDDIEVITIGKKLQRAIVRSGGILVADFPFGTTLPLFESVIPVTDILVDGYMKGEYKRVCVLYTQFVSLRIQKAKIEQILPVPAQQEVSVGPYHFEPNPWELLTALMPHYLEMSLYQIFLESYASEQAARMFAMHQASENAKDIILELSLIFNKARQERITNELLDISSGKAYLAL